MAGGAARCGTAGAAVDAGVVLVGGRDAVGVLDEAAGAAVESGAGVGITGGWVITTASPAASTAPTTITAICSGFIALVPILYISTLN